MKETKQKFIHYAFVVFTYGVGLITVYAIAFAFITIIKETVL